MVKIKYKTNDVWEEIFIPSKTSEIQNDSGYLTEHQDISGKENTSNKVTSISAQSTDTQYPSSKSEVIHNDSD